MVAGFTGSGNPLIQYANLRVQRLCYIIKCAEANAIRDYNVQRIHMFWIDMWLRRPSLALLESV